MSTKTILILILTAALAGCDQSSQVQNDGKNDVTNAVTNSEKIIDSNIKSIEQDYLQQAYDTLPPKRQD